MARDRRRAKRRKREEQGHKPPESTPTPGPLDHASAEVEEARLAEEGHQPPPMTEEQGEFGPEVERAPDEIEGDLVPTGKRGHPEAEYYDEEHEERPRWRVFQFLRNVVEELKRVQWPDRRQTAQGTAITLGFVIIAGGYLGLLDLGIAPLVKKFL